MDKFPKIVLLLVLIAIGAALGIRRVIPSGEAADEGDISGIKHRVEILENALGNLTPSQPANVAVDCSAGESIQSAINEHIQNLAPINVTITGICTEEVNIFRDHIAIRGSQSGDGLQAPSPDSFALININQARYIQLEQLTLSGGQIGVHATANANFEATKLNISGSHQGISVNLGASGVVTDSHVDNCDLGARAVWNGSLRLIGSTISNSKTFGVSSSAGGTVQLFGQSVVTKTAFHGAYASEGGSIDITHSTVEESTGFGVHADSGGVVSINEGGLVQKTEGAGALANTGGVVEMMNGARLANNHGHGATVWAGGSMNIRDGSVIEGNNGDGINVNVGSTATLESGSIIRNNGGFGAVIGDVSVMGFSNDTQVINNDGTGISCANSPAVAQIAGSPGTVSGNGSDVIECP